MEQNIYCKEQTISSVIKSVSREGSTHKKNKTK